LTSCKKNNHFCKKKKNVCLQKKLYFLKLQITINQLVSQYNFKQNVRLERNCKEITLFALRAEKVVNVASADQLRRETIAIEKIYELSCNSGVDRSKPDHALGKRVKQVTDIL
jgi:membrane-bound lytic murein transglycosylase MltF